LDVPAAFHKHARIEKSFVEGEILWHAHASATLASRLPTGTYEETILNSFTAADTLTGWQGRTAYALPLDDLRRIMAKYGRL
jgi:hypothetical protein